MKWDPDAELADPTDTSGISQFVHVRQAMQDRGRELGRGSYWHGGLRSFDFHPLGNRTHGRFYVSAMESGPSENATYADWKARGVYLPWAADQYYTEHPTPQAEESVLIEFLYADGIADRSTYRLLFRVECPIYDHTIRQISFGVDDLTTYENETLLLYVLHGDGSVESSDVGNGQYNDALGKILRINPIGGLVAATAGADHDDVDVHALELGEGDYTTEHNPWDPLVDEPGFRLAPLPLDAAANRSPVPREAFAIGFRNPHSLAFAKDGLMLLGEAARDNFEEVNVIKKGRDYGWPYYEGAFEHVIETEKDVKGLFHSALPPIASHYCPTCEIRFPLVSYGHRGFDQMQFNSVAIVGQNSVLENDSPAARHTDEPHSPHVYQDGAKYFLADFPYSGELYYAYLEDARTAHATGDPSAGDVEIAPMFRAKVKFDGVVYDSLRPVMAVNESDIYSRVNCRFGTGPDGAMLIISKETGKIYKVVNTIADETTRR